MRSFRTALAVALVGALALAACGDDDDESSDTTGATTAAGGSVTPTTGSGPITVTVGAADFSESQVLAEIYAEALENGGVLVARKDPIGSRELYYKAIENNEIQLVPEYTNSLLSYVLRLSDPKATPTAKTVDEQVAALKQALPKTLTVGTPSTAENKDVIVCSSAVADKYSLKTLSDLAKVSDQITLGAPPEFESRSPFGLVGFKDIYGANFKEFVPLQISVMAESIKSGAIDCGNMFSTMSAITTEGLVALEDDKTIVPHESVLPLLRAEVATPQVLTVLDQVSSGLTTDVLKALDVKVEVDKKTPSDVAKEYLASVSQG